MRVALSLLVAVVQVAGTVAAIPSANSPVTGLYFCCCIGECSCTGDCCNHEPTPGGDSQLPVLRIGVAGPTIEAPKSCGVWRATLQRGPDNGKVIASNTRARSPIPPSSPVLGSVDKKRLVSIDEGLQPCSPRAPPSTQIRT